MANYIPSSSDKIVLAESLDRTKPFYSISMFAAHQFLRTLWPEGFLHHKTLKNGSVLFEVSDKNDLTASCKEHAIEHNGEQYSIKLSLHETLNYAKGTFINKRLNDRPLSELQAELKDQKVIKIERVPFEVDGVPMQSSRYVLTFDSTAPPEFIQVGFDRIAVKKFFEAPLFCTKCQKYRHTKNNCKNAAVCKTCATAHKKSKPCGPVKCVNCQGGHPANDRDCPIKKQEIAIRRIQANDRLNPTEARRQYFEQKKADDAENDLETQVEEVTNKLEQLEKSSEIHAKIISELYNKIKILEQENCKLQQASTSQGNLMAGAAGKSKKGKKKYTPLELE